MTTANRHCPKTKAPNLDHLVYETPTNAQEAAALVTSLVHAMPKTAVLTGETFSATVNLCLSPQLNDIRYEGPVTVNDQCSEFAVLGGVLSVEVREDGLCVRPTMDSVLSSPLKSLANLAETELRDAWLSRECPQFGCWLFLAALGMQALSRSYLYSSAGPAETDIDRARRVLLHLGCMTLPPAQRQVAYLLKSDWAGSFADLATATKGILQS